MWREQTVFVVVGLLLLLLLLFTSSSFFQQVLFQFLHHLQQFCKRDYTPNPEYVESMRRKNVQMY